MDDRTPEHYRSSQYHCLPVMADLKLDKDFYLGNAFKYLWRCMTHKDGTRSNIEKAKHYLELWLEKETNGQIL